MFLSPFLFHGEELLIGARLWTHGWDVYVPPVTLVGHVYGSKEKNVFTDHSQTWVHQNQQSGLRARYLLKEYEGPPPDMREIDILGMGQSRSLEWYMYFAGLNLKLKVESNRCDSKYDPVQQIWIPV